MPSAAEKVLAIPELLEAILLNTDWRDLFVLQRVNTGFREMIALSTKLQQRMYLKYKTLDKAFSSLPPKQRGDNFIIHELDNKKELDFGPFVKSRKGVDSGISGDPPAFRVDLLPELPWGSIWNSDRQALALTSFWVREDVLSGSWREIKLTASPVALYIKVQVYPPKNAYSGYVYFEAGGGNLGEFVDSVQRIYRNGARFYQKKED